MLRFNCRRMFAASIVAAALCGVVLPRAGYAEEKKQKTELNKQMEEMDSAMKKLKVSIRKAEADKTSLELITKIEGLAVACKQLTPSKAATLPEAERPKFLIEYRKQMASLVSDMCAMETALLDGNHPKAQEIYKKLKTDEENGHDQFMQDEDKDSSKSEK